MARYKAAVIGLGNIGLLYDLELQRPHPSSHVVAYRMSSAFDLVCGIDDDKGKSSLLQSNSSKALFFSSLDDAISSDVLTNVDVVSICTPPDTHLDILFKLIHLQTVKVIFCEKPVVSNLDEAKRLLSELDYNKDVIVVPNISRRWNKGLRKVSDIIESGELGKVDKIHIKYTRGIDNTGTHLFDLLKMWTGSRIRRVQVLGETRTSAFPEPSYSFYFEMESDVTGYAEAIDDTQYYLFEIDLYLSNGKIEMRNSGDEVIYYCVKNHHLFSGFKELYDYRRESGLLQDACMKNAIDNIANVLDRKEEIYCNIEDATYPLYIADKLRKSYIGKRMEEIDYG